MVIKSKGLSKFDNPLFLIADQYDYFDFADRTLCSKVF
jgi:hypothetical protein